MIIQTPIKANDVIAMKLVTSEEVIAKVLDINDKQIIVSKPLAMTLMPTNNGGANVAFVPWSLAMDESEKVTFERSSIVATYKARKEAQATYVQQTTGLTIL